MNKKVSNFFIVFFFVLLSSCASQKALYKHSYKTPELLAQEILTAIAKSDSSRLARVLMTEFEYKNIFYKSLPDSIQNAMPVDFAWNFVQQDSRKALKRYLAEFGGQKIKLKQVFFRFPPQHFEGFTVYRGMVMEVEYPNGDAEKWRFMNVVLEQKGFYKGIAFND